MYLHAENVTVDTDEGRFVLLIDSTEEDRITVEIHGIDLDTFYDQVKGRIGPYLREKREAAVTHGAQKRAEYDREVYDHERTTGQHAPFLCAVEDVDESAGAYEPISPKHPHWHSIHADLYDQREDK